MHTLFTDIDGTLTQSGRLPENSYSALWRLHGSGIKIVPITGRPAGWCDLIARFWPVHGVIGENGALAYRYDGERMHRFEAVSPEDRRSYRQKLKNIARDVLRQVPAARIARDQFSRRFDLAIDIAEDVKPLRSGDILKIQSIFESHGAHAKVSNIHVNGWFGDYDKLSACRRYCREWLGFSLAEEIANVAFIGDSPNDEPLFGFFKNSYAVANVKKFIHQMKFKPALVSKKSEADGFCEIVEKFIRP